MIDPMLSLAHTVYSAKGVFALLVGSGISRSAGIPTGWEITLDLARRLAALGGAVADDDPERWYREQFGKAPDYSDIINALAKSPAERRNLLHGYFEPTPEEREDGQKQPSPAHRAIAKLVARGFIRVLVTTNFDRLLETALRDEGVEPMVIYTADAADGAAPLVHQQCVVLKLHGDYLDDRIKNTDGELSDYDEKMSSYLDRVLDEFGLVICGWSGEWDPALRAALERCKSRRYTTYWAVKENLDEKAKNLAFLRQAQMLPISDADKFFTSLEAMVTSLEVSQSPGPLSIVAAVASVKRFVADPLHRVKFHDLLVDEAASVRKRFTTGFPIQDKWSVDEFRRRAAAYEGGTEKLRHMLFHASHWADDNQQDAIVKSLTLLAHGPRINNYSLNAWRDFRKYPLSLAFYSSGLGALAGKNYEMLRALFNIVLDWEGEQTALLKLAPASRVIPVDVARNLIGLEIRNTPLSDRIFEITTDMVSYLTSDAEFLFDKFEIFVAIAFLSKKLYKSSTENSLMPSGRYCWKTMSSKSPSAIVLAEADREGDAWLPLQRKVFDDKIGQWHETRPLFDEMLIKHSQRFY